VLNETLEGLEPGPQRAEAEAASALDNFRDAVDMHDLLFDLEALRIDPLHDRSFS
jgi:hypothetical protein